MRHSFRSPTCATLRTDRACRSLVGNSEFVQSRCRIFAVILYRNRAVQAAALAVVADCVGEDCYLASAPSAGSAAHRRGGYPHKTGCAKMSSTSVAHANR